MQGSSMSLAASVASYAASARDEKACGTEQDASSETGPAELRGSRLGLLTQHTLEATLGSAPRPSIRHCSSGSRYTSLMAASGSSSQMRPMVHAVVSRTTTLGSFISLIMVGIPWRQQRRHPGGPPLLPLLPEATHLEDERFELAHLRSFQDGAKGHDGGVPASPVRVFDVFLDEGQDVRQDIVLAAGGQQHQAHAGRLAGVPVVVVVVLVLQQEPSHVRRLHPQHLQSCQLCYLLGEGLGQDGHQVLQSPFGVELTGVLRGASLLRGL